MKLAYYSVAAVQDFWSEHWGDHSVAELLEIARRSPLTTLVTDALPREGLVLEAGCGLGQYVVLLRERGYRALGVDWSSSALASCRGIAAVPPPLAAMELHGLAIRDAALAAYISLGVVEHDPAGPDALLGEARRVLAPGGVLVVSVPYLNGMRRLAAPYLRRRNGAVARTGGAFYQYVFSRRELVRTLERHGFAVKSAHPYDPARMLRRIVSVRFGSREAARPGRSDGPAAPGARRVARTAARRLLYSGPALRLLGHMLLIVAVKT